MSRSLAVRASLLVASLTFGLVACAAEPQLRDVPEVVDTETRTPGDTPANEADRPGDDDGEPLTED